jgi:hypothetical protein
MLESEIASAILAIATEKNASVRFDGVARDQASGYEKDHQFMVAERGVLEGTRQHTC